MPTTTSARIQDHFNNLTDPRRREGTYPLINIVTIAQEIIDAEADYVLAAKDNQKTPRQGISWFFLSKQAEDFRGVRVSRYETHEKGEGRKETRQYFVCAVPRDWSQRKRWPGLKAIGWTISTTVRDGRTCREMRYYNLSRKLTAKQFAAAVRGHWSIENSLHWQLDVTFQEDQSRVRKGHADANFSILRRTALSLLENTFVMTVHRTIPPRDADWDIRAVARSKKLQGGVKNKRPGAAWDDAYLQQVLLGQ